MIIIFWEMTPCGSYKNRRFGGSSTSLCLYKSFQLRSVTCSHSCTLKMEAIRSSQKMIIIIVTAVETSDLRFVYSSQRPDRLWGLPSLLFQWLPGALSVRVERPGRETGHSPPSNAEVKKSGDIPLLPSCLHGVVLLFLRLILYQCTRET
jgi:hypothetical protein